MARRGERVVVASGPATAGIVADFGFERQHLELGRGSNPGVIRAEHQPGAEADSLRGFFDATRRGMVPTLTYQASQRLTDLMWQPVAKARATLDVVDAVRPDTVLVDHLAFSARLALWAADVRHADVVLGHPSALPVGGEVYGYPPVWPRAFRPDPGALEELELLCRRVAAGFTAEWNRAADGLDPGLPTVDDAFALHGPLVLYNYPAELAAPERTHALPPHHHLGGALRTEAHDPQVEAWLTGGEPFVYVSFGSFLSVRADVLARVVEALRATGVRAAIATGSTSPDRLGDLPAGWLVRDYLPQVRLLRDAAVAVTHGGNNSVTESVATGTPMLVLPFSTDQFAGAAAVEDAGMGQALDPNAATVPEIRDALVRLLDASASGVPALEGAAGALAADPGPARALRAVRSSAGASASSPWR
ncbi:nucleotide disphospho-sugar-binding domain-containing protein [Cellulomonas sp. ATA003]|uniref:nucleotide disphospho-sugar-binding domain-containing protein n=1 Tax=Cellulomonas sp. ATA003 TaxID=3073064 RepID=UPI002872C2DE|nr:nucleotide disphospho-sugar-binding domain-containing protein [Cellulomonas sp. ATA003]WNB86944.1 glycosyltransferase [Cellulomonas sp. ATA003]